jgi:hypothetical protein
MFVFESRNFRLQRLIALKQFDDDRAAINGATCTIHNGRRACIKTLAESEIS